MPGWPGPTLVAGGALLGVGALVALSLVTAGQLRVASTTGLLILAIVGGAAFALGLVYVAVHQIRIRSFLPPERYRGPSVLVLTVLALVVANVAVLPFVEDIAALALGTGKLSTLGTVVILLSTQAALLFVAWAFVHVPRALSGLPDWRGRDPGGAVRTGVLWGLGIWIPASILSALVLLVLEAIGFQLEPETAELVLERIDPWLLVIPIVVVAPIVEEIFFRGVVFNAFLREGGRRWAYLGSALLFGAIHLSVVQFLPIVLLGLVLARVYERTGSLLAPIAVHATFNLLSVVLALLVRFDVIRLPA